MLAVVAANIPGYGGYLRRVAVVFLLSHHRYLIA